MNKRLDFNDKKLINDNNKNYLKKSNNNLNKNNEFLKKNCIKGDIFYADLGEVKGSEQGGIRPVIVIQNNKGNQHSPTVIVAAITTQHKNNMPTHVEIQGFGLDRDSVIMLEQIRTLSKKDRLKEHIGTVGVDMLKKIDIACLISLGISA